MAGKKIRKPRGIKVDGTPNITWTRFINRLHECETVSVDKWTDEHVLGYIFKRYREHTGIEYTLSYRGGAKNCAEMFCVRRMISYLGVSDKFIIKNYIDWVYDNIICKQNVSIKSVGFFFTVDFISKFKSELRKSQKITRSTSLPEVYTSIISEFEPNINTYGDLAFIKMAMDSNLKYPVLFERLKDNGFDDSILDLLEN